MDAATFLDLNPELQADGEVVTVEDAVSKGGQAPYSQLPSSMPATYHACTFDARMFITQFRDAMNVSALNSSIRAAMQAEGWWDSALDEQARYECTISRPAVLLAPNTLSFDVSRFPMPGSGGGASAYALTSSNLSVDDLVRISTQCGDRHYARVASLLPDGCSFTLSNTTQGGAPIGGHTPFMCNSNVMYTVYGIRLYDAARVARINLVRIAPAPPPQSSSVPATLQVDFNATLYRLLYDDLNDDLGADLFDDGSAGEHDDDDAATAPQRAFEDYRDRWAQGDFRVGRAADIHNNNSPYNAFTDLGVSNLFVANVATLGGEVSAGFGALVVHPGVAGPCGTGPGGCAPGPVPGSGEVVVNGLLRAGGSNLVVTPTSVYIGTDITLLGGVSAGTSVSVSGSVTNALVVTPYDVTFGAPVVVAQGTLSAGVASNGDIALLVASNLVRFTAPVEVVDSTLTVANGGVVALLVASNLVTFGAPAVMEAGMTVSGGDLVVRGGGMTVSGGPLDVPAGLLAGRSADTGVVALAVASNLVTFGARAAVDAGMGVSNGMTVSGGLGVSDGGMTVSGGVTVADGALVAMSGIETAYMSVWHQFGFGADPLTAESNAGMVTWPLAPPWDATSYVAAHGHASNGCSSSNYYSGTGACPTPSTLQCPGAVETLRVEAELYVGNSGWVFQQVPLTTEADEDGMASLVLSHPAMAADGTAHVFMADGRVGLGIGHDIPAASASDATQGFCLTVDGDALVTGVIQNQSDRRLKTDVQHIQGGLQRVLALNGYTYMMHGGERHYTGLMAQEVAAVLPEATHRDEGSGMMSIAYAHLAGLFVEAIKDLNEEVLQLRLELQMQPRMQTPHSERQGHHVAGVEEVPHDDGDAHRSAGTCQQVAAAAQGARRPRGSKGQHERGQERAAPGLVVPSQGRG